MNTPTFSIIIPVYNAAIYLPSLLMQLKAQTRQDFEIIFINDCSPDKSADILSRLARKDERVRVFIHTKNRGQGAARNTGLDHARGEYVLYIDADDSVPSNYLESLYSAAKKHDTDLVICNSVWVYQDRKLCRNMFIDHPDLPELLVSGQEALQRFYSVYLDDIRIPVEPWGRIVRRSMIEKYHLRNPETLHEDVVMCFSELLCSRRVLFLNEYLYYYNRTNTGSVIIERKRKYFQEFPNIFSGIRNILFQCGCYEGQKKWLTRFYFGFLARVYDTYSKGEVFSEEMYEAIIQYRTLHRDLHLAGSEEYILKNLLAFKFQMERYGMHDVFSLFIEAHPEVQVLIRKNLRYAIMYYSNLLMRYEPIRMIYKILVIDPETERRRHIITKMLFIYRRGLMIIRKNHDGGNV